MTKKSENRKLQHLVVINDKIIQMFDFDDNLRKIAFI